jgi:hypothetical protein
MENLMPSDDHAAAGAVPPDHVEAALHAIAEELWRLNLALWYSPSPDAEPPSQEQLDEIRSRPMPCGVGLWVRELVPKLRVQGHSEAALRQAIRAGRERGLLYLDGIESAAGESYNEASVLRPAEALKHWHEPAGVPVLGPLAGDHRRFLAAALGQVASRASSAPPTSPDTDGAPPVGQVAAVPPPTIPALKPHWDADRRELSYGGTVCKKYRQGAPNQTPILDVFEESDWPSRIDDPLPGGHDNPQQRLADAIRGLNTNSAILFERDGTTEGILWKPKPP